MFEEQIELLERLINDWEGIVKGTPQFKWEMNLGICSNCHIGINTLIYDKGFSYEEALTLRKELNEGFPHYSGEPAYPIQTKEEYNLMTKFTDHPLRLSLAKHYLEYLKNIHVAC